MSYQDVQDANIRDNDIYIMKRSGVRVPFDSYKIIKAIEKANKEVTITANKLPKTDIQSIAANIEMSARNASRDYSVEEIQDLVENELMLSGKTDLARKYITYRYRHNQKRDTNGLDQRILAIIQNKSEEAKEENSNKNTTIVSVQRDYMAGEWSRYYTNEYLLPKDISDAHKQGSIHFHDSDYAAMALHNCCLINLEDMLQNGTRISGTLIETPKSFATCCTVTSQIIAQVASMQYGGQTISLAHIAPFVDVSRRKLRKRFIKKFKKAAISFTEEQLNAIVEATLLEEIEAGCQTIQYQLVTLQTTNGQAPFVTVFMYLNEVPEGQTRDDLALLIKIMLKQRYQGIKDPSGNYITPAFPKLIYVLQEDNIREDGKYWYLTELACTCMAKRMVPDLISEKKMLELKGEVYPCMGCRSFLTPDRFTDKGLRNIANAGNWDRKKHKYYGRFNMGVVTINLVDVACSSGKDETEFWNIFEKRLELCHRALRIRYEHLLGTPSDVAPIQWQDGALARLAPGETIDELLKHGYATISLGYAGLAECTQYMKGCSHTHPDGKEFALAVMQKLNDKCNEWKDAEDIDYSVYGTPLESTTYKFAKALQRRFGIIPNVTDHNYITNSYHVNVREELDAFTKLTLESEFQKLSPGGAISYVEVPNMENNMPALIAIVKHIYETIMYAEINTKSDLCIECGYTGEMQIVQVDGKLGWECPCCHNRDQTKMKVARRTCGYIGTQYWNQGRTQEIRDRVLHVSIETYNPEDTVIYDPDEPNKLIDEKLEQALTNDNKTDEKTYNPEDTVIYEPEQPNQMVTEELEEALNSNEHTANKPIKQ